VDNINIPLERRMIMQLDSKKNEYIEIDVSEFGKNESLRITKVKEGYNGEPCLRLQIREEGKGPRPGPEVPINYAQEIVNAISALKK
jgi:hypothetical protein